MKKRFAILLTLLAALLLCGCGERADDQRWLWSSEEITPPTDFGYVLTVASTEDEVFAVSHTALGRYENGEITVLDPSTPPTRLLWSMVPAGTATYCIC